MYIILLFFKKLYKKTFKIFEYKKNHNFELKKVFVVLRVVMVFFKSVIFNEHTYITFPLLVCSDIF